MYKLQDIMVYCIIMASSCYINLLIAPNFPLSYPGAYINTSKEFALENDLSFTKFYKVHTIQAIFGHQDMYFALLAIEVATLPSCLKKHPSKIDCLYHLHQYNQLLGHPCDDYLYSAH